MEDTRRLDVLAQAMIGTIAAVAGLMTLLGLNSDRIWATLDDDAGHLPLIAAAVAAVVAIGLSLLALLVEQRRREAALLAGAAVAYLLALLLAVLSAASAANTAGRPTFTSVSLATTADGGAELAFVVKADSLDSDQRIAVEVGAGADFAEQVLVTTLRPSPLGRVEHEATLTLPGELASSVRIRAARTDDTLRECNESAVAPTCVILTVGQ
ncbi:hypothetical protein FE374_17095 [Georgenia yuyongxinii]|uniref:Uncharacterized protein n=1 Tax=Georgenia yuyongxinii TaxID=2589797 RepID=A0A5B8C7N4_9MICO|nr:hypothetical protein [Georgenia yuyongxinii]QDC26097.1 hypothetical protein FE374_17095 [Georgenia yuyongxinii]